MDLCTIVPLWDANKLIELHHIGAHDQGCQMPYTSGWWSITHRGKFSFALKVLAILH